MIRSSILFLSATLAIPALSQAQLTGQATYEVTFDATWSSGSHPTAYPGGAHFSPLIGASHGDSVVFWEPGGQATTGIERMAELGSASVLQNEVDAAIQAGTALEVINGSGVNSPGVVSTSFSISDEFPLVTLVTMIAPSPDWFVGVHGLSLLDNGRFVDELSVPLYAYDAGTDDGTGFNSPNLDSNPQTPIALITGGPFLGTVPLGTFTFRRSYGSQLYGCGVNPAGSLSLLGGEPRIGTTVVYGLHDPTGGMNSPAATFLLIAEDPLGSFPCGFVLQRFGLAAPGANSELLIDLVVPPLRVDGPQWTGTPAPIALDIPLSPSLVGESFYLQGILGDGTRLGLTGAVETLIGS